MKQDDAVMVGRKGSLVLNHHLLVPNFIFYENDIGCLSQSKCGFIPSPKIPFSYHLCFLKV